MEKRTLYAIAIILLIISSTTLLINIRIGMYRVFPEEHQLTVNIQGRGYTDPPEGNHTYEHGTEVTVNAIPSSGHGFSHFSGDCEEKTCELEMTRDKEVTAHFRETVQITKTE